MKTELNMNELENVNGGNIFEDVKDVLKKLIPNPFEPKKPEFPLLPDPIIARG